MLSEKTLNIILEVNRNRESRVESNMSSMDWFLYDNGLPLERVKAKNRVRW